MQGCNSRLNRRGLLGLSGAMIGLAVGMSPVYAAVKRPEPGLDGTFSAEVNGVRWAYRDKGKGPPALFLHSFLLNSNLWIDQLNGLSDIRRIIAPDMRGWGRSEPVSDLKLDPNQYAADIVTFLDAIGVKEPVDLVGLSVGAFICGLVYERIPKRVASLTLISAAFDFQRDLAYERYQAEMARVAVVEGKDAMFRRFDEYIDGSAASLHQRARYKQMLLETRTEMIVAYLANAGRAPARPDLPKKIQVPVLLPVGGEDSVVSPERAEAMKTTFNDAEVVRIKGAGRLLSIESPDEFNAALRGFWTGRAKR